MIVLTPDDVRMFALSILAKYPKGIRQIELFRQTERMMSYSYHIESEHTIKNALWNLEDLEPRYVKKVKKSARLVLFFPTEELIRKEDKTKSEVSATSDSSLHDIEISPSDIIFENQHTYSVEETYPNRVSIDLIGNKVLELWGFIERSGLEQQLNLSKEDLITLSMGEIEAIMGLKSILAQLKKHRNMLVHSNKLWDQH
ncbi:hypothetical protein [Paenibacillus terrigena]|uniref:hypothetical protein n=1 Tax=Paenibacillus terrigena TaxID=369333 RepID=UPI000375A296|nr:hypothetical protein [Paenibacillus terrigena]